MNQNNPEKRHISVTEARRILKEQGLDLSPNETAVLLDFLYLFALFSIKHLRHTRYENR